MGKPFFDRFIGNRGDPQTADRLMTAGFVQDPAGNQFSLTSGICRIVLGGDFSALLFNGIQWADKAVENLDFLDVFAIDLFPLLDTRILSIS